METDDMILIADSGASKTDWACVCPETGETVRFKSQGYNPNYISPERIESDIRKNMPGDFPVQEVRWIFFYGAGVTPLQYPMMRAILLKVFPRAVRIDVAMDTLASCRALLGDSPGFAAILGTGSNTCLYDGRNEGLNVDSCGFILGDEGSGAYLGKRMITDYIRRNMPENVLELVGTELGMDNEQLLDRIYTRPFPNRFCAQYAKFINDNLETDPYFPELVLDAFRKFFGRIVSHYPDYRSYRFNAVGSVAWHFRPLLKKVAGEFGMETGTIAKAPMEGLVRYHTDHYEDFQAIC